jgi:parvulin-like peptidyl-prolyl isomerase
LGKGKSKSGAAGRFSSLAPLQRLGLLVFGVAFLGLFVGFAVAEGIGQPSVPSGDVALVQSVPSDLGHVSEAEYKRSFLQTIAQAGLKKAPKPGDEKYEEVKKQALSSLFDTIWIQGEAEELGISVTPKQIATELATIKKQNFKTEAEFKKFLKTSHYTKSDVNERVKLQVLSTQIQQQVGNEAPTPSSSQIQEFYDAAKSTQFTTPESRDIRVVLNKDKAKVEKAKALLEKDDSAASWKKVAKRYSTDPTTKATGGLQSSLTKESAEATLGPQPFSSPEGQVVGPVKATSGYVVFEVEKVTPEKVQPLEQVKSQISSQLEQQGQQEFFARFVADFSSKWESRTFCASGYVIERCSNYKASGHSAEADPACYESNPKKAPEACPAPVLQLKPALPGTVSILMPTGQQLAQRPQPAGLKPVEEGASLEGLPPGVTGAPPTAP